MRIIAGEHRGRRIAAPPGDSTRPMLDRVRESVFATLGNLVEDAHVLDLFAGGGSLGLEALSRGALDARFVERDPRAYSTLKANIAELGFGHDRAIPVRGNALVASSWTVVDVGGGKKSRSDRAKQARAGDETPAAGEAPASDAASVPSASGGYDLVLLDPPYAIYDDPPQRAKLLEALELLIAKHLRPGGALVVHAPTRALESVRLRRTIATDLRQYGASSCLYVFPDARATTETA
jgi:16S rRNA G966 N2-methylase RsmD